MEILYENNKKHVVFSDWIFFFIYQCGMFSIHSFLWPNNPIMIYLIFKMHLLNDGNLCSFHFLVTMHNAAMNIYIQVMHLAEFLGQMVTTFNTLRS